jgi:alpha-2-macroglobulin
MRILRPFGRVWTILLGITVLGLFLGLAMRMLLPAAPWISRPTLIALSPAPGEADVVPRSSISLRFSLPMNRRSVEQALLIDPPTQGTLTWNDEATELTFRPTVSLTPAMTYTITLGPAALGRWWQPLAPTPPGRFRTAPLPSVVSTLPEGTAVATTAPLALVFSQTMVDQQALSQPASLPLVINPPLPVAANWLDERTVLLQPLEPMRPATTYSARLAASLTDARGIALEQPVSWGWTTAWPALLARSPDNEARQVGPRTALTMTLAAPVELDKLRAALSITPAVAGELSASTTISGTQVITFTPTVGWQPNQSYSVALASSAQPTVWRFTTSPDPGIVSLFPGQGQILPRGQALRLRFSTPMDLASLQTNLQIEPSVDPFALEVNDAEVRLMPDLAPSSTYTLTIGPQARDRNGTALGTAYTLTLRTATAPANLEIAAAIDRVVSLPISRTASLTVTYTNLAALDMALYRLDEATLVRVLNFGASEWGDFRPERYGLQLQQQWRVALATPTDQQLQATVPISQSDGNPLAAGAYYLRARTSEGPRADLVVLVQPLLLGLITNNQNVLVWVVDRAGQPVANQQVTIYNSNGAIALGSTDSSGLYRARVASSVNPANLLAVASDTIGVVRQGWLAAPPAPDSPELASFLFPERHTYRAGETVLLHGFARRQNSNGSISFPAGSSPCRLQLQPLASNSSARPATRGINASELAIPAAQVGDCMINNRTGVISASISLPASLAPGSYLLRSTIDDSVNEQLLQVAPAEPVADLALVGELDSQGNVLLDIQRAGEPLTSAPVRWQLHLLPTTTSPFPTGYVISERAPYPRLSSSGTAQTNQTGQITIPLPQVLTRTLTYALDLVVEEPGGETGFLSLHGQLDGQAPWLGLRLPQRALTSADLPRIELLARDGDGAPRPDTTISVALYRGTTISGSPALERRARTDDQGLASLELVQLTPGEYQVVARLEGIEVRDRLVVTRAAFTGWNNPPQQISVVPDRASYQVGDIAQLVVTSPTISGTGLLSISTGRETTSSVVTIEAGALLTVTITPEMAPAARVGLLLAANNGLLGGGALLPVEAPPPALLGSLVAEQTSLPAGASLPITFTAVTTSQVLIAISSAEDPLAQIDLAAQLQAGYSPDQHLARSRLAGELPLPSGQPTMPAMALAEAPTIVLPPQNVPAGQPLVVELPLPERTGRWRVIAYATAETNRFLAASVEITTTPTISAQLLLPTRLHQGDRAIVTLDLRNPGSELQNVVVQLNSIGAQIAFSTPARRQRSLAGGQQERLAWEISAGSATTATLALTLEAGPEQQVFTSTLAILDAPAAPSTSPLPGVALQQSYHDPTNGRLLDPATIQVGSLINIRATLVTAQPLGELELQLALPGALRLVRLLPEPAFDAEGEPETGMISYRATELVAGMYQVSYLARVIASGDYRAPGPRALIGETTITGAETRVIVQQGGITP